MADTYATTTDTGEVALSSRAARLTVESHAIAARAFIVGDSGALAPLPLISGSVDSDAGSAIRRSASIGVYGRWIDDDRAALAPYGTRVRIERGIRLDRSSIEWVPLITGRITDISQSSDDKESALSVSVKDDMFTVKQDRFDVATKTITTEKVVDAIERLLFETLPGHAFTDLTGSTALCGEIDLQRDRADAIGSLATSIGATCYATRDGSGFVLRPTPTFDDLPRWTLSVGDGGSIVSVDRSRSAEGTYNRVFAYGESNNSAADAPPPVSGSASITDIDDPLRYGGPFGKVTRFYKSPLITTTGQATDAAASLLEKARGRNYEISFSTLVNPALDPDHVIESTVSDGIKRRHIVESVSLPLSPSDTQSVSVRTVEALPEEAA